MIYMNHLLTVRVSTTSLSLKRLLINKEHSLHRSAYIFFAEMWVCNLCVSAFMYTHTR